MASSATSQKHGEALVWFGRACAQQRRMTRWSDQGIAIIHGSKCQSQPTPGSSQPPPEQSPSAAATQKMVWWALGTSQSLATHGGTWFTSREGGPGSAQVRFWGRNGPSCKPPKPLSLLAAVGGVRGLCNTRSRGLISINKANRLKPQPLLALPPLPHLP